MQCMKSPFYFLFQWTKQNCIDWPFMWKIPSIHGPICAKKKTFLTNLQITSSLEDLRIHFLLQCLVKILVFNCYFTTFVCQYNKQLLKKVSNSAKHLCKHQLYDVIYSIALGGPIYRQKWANLC